MKYLCHIYEKVWRGIENAWCKGKIFAFMELGRN